MAPARPSLCAWCETPLPATAPSVPGGLRCARCDAVTTSPWPTDAELDAAYATHYRPDEGRFSGPGDAVLKRLRQLPAARIDRRAPPGPILDVGAGDGWLVEALQRRGRTAVAFEREDGDLLDHRGTYAAVVFWHSLEHLRRPGAALAHAATHLLRPGGLVVIAIPNPASLQARLFKDRWLALDPPRHLVHVPRRTLTTTLERHGLTVERTSATRGGQVLFGWLHGVVKTLPRHPDLYDAIRRPDAQQRRVANRPAVLTAGAVAAPLALAGTAIEVASANAGTTYVEARKR